MAYWLFKSEPDVWSFADQTAKGAAGEPWTGVRNFQARNHMKAMKAGDRGFFYHTGGEKQVVGIVEVAAEAHPEPGADPQWVCVDLRAVEPLPRPVTLAEAKANPKLADMMLVKAPRLSVQPVTEAEWAEICRMGGLG